MSIPLLTPLAGTRLIWFAFTSSHARLPASGAARRRGVGSPARVASRLESLALDIENLNDPTCMHGFKSQLACGVCCAAREEERRRTKTLGRERVLILRKLFYLPEMVRMLRDWRDHDFGLIEEHLKPDYDASSCPASLWQHWSTVLEIDDVLGPWADTPDRREFAAAHG